jgi:hypothetical protein
MDGMVREGAGQISGRSRQVRPRHAAMVPATPAAREPVGNKIVWQARSAPDDCWSPAFRRLFFPAEVGTWATAHSTLPAACDKFAPPLPAVGWYFSGDSHTIWSCVCGRIGINKNTMNPFHSSEGPEAAAGEFNRHERRQDGDRIVRGLTAGLDSLRDAFYLRIHRDVQQTVGHDSMLMPVSELKAEQQTEEEIEVYQAAEAAEAASRHGYVTGGGDEWFLLWLARLRLGERAPEVEERLRDYYGRSSEQRALSLTNALAAVLPESMQAPLVLFRIAPLAVELAVALAFDDQATASVLRQEQRTLLPPIAYCQDCHGEVLALGEQCQVCGNPLWKHKWLTAID